jgi:hypothetical protein
MKTFNVRLIALAVSALFFWTTAIASDQTGNQSPENKAPGGEDLRAAVQNPVGAM